jgi:hypothetical protein
LAEASGRAEVVADRGEQRGAHLVGLGQRFDQRCLDGEAFLPQR